MRPCLMEQIIRYKAIQSGHKQLVVSIPRLSAPSCHLGTEQNQRYGTIFIMVSILSINTDVL